MLDVTFSRDLRRLPPLLVTEKYPGTMLPRGQHGGEPAGEKKLASSNILLDCGRLTTNHTRWHVVSRVLKVHRKNKYLLGTLALIVYGIMRLRFHVPLALLFVTSATKPAVGQCPSYTEYSQVDALNSRLHRYRYDVLRARTERRRRAHSVSHICGQTLPVEPSQVLRWR